jgi:predicted PurR-regulated permease PerM
LILIGALVGAGILVGTRAVDEANALSRQFPALVSRWEQFSNGPGNNSLEAQIVRKIKEQIAQRSNELLASLPRAGLKFLSVASDAVYVIVIPILGFFFLKDGAEIREYFRGLVNSSRQRAMLDDLFADVHLLLAHYMRAVITLALCTMICYSVALSIMGLQYAILLGAVAGLLEFIPMIGPLCGMVISLVVGGFGGSSIVAMIIFLLVYRLFLDYVLSPYVMGSGVELHPLAVLFGVFAGAEVAGIAGAFLSVPILALLRVLYRWIRKVRPPEPSPATIP